ncbi:MAG: filamentous hemagglutinin N-terminal domain-containing protein [Candidatus Electrothrix sp. GW3-4]|uniref:two-partner secretion domain-containing protein n=1 Tax=Candidatus Electrothrix sp. GW3-4 TaxID=3126740 RepID=UPI0030CE89C9
MLKKNNHVCSFAILVASLLTLSLYAPLCWAEITLDGTVGPAGTLSGPDFLIWAELGKISGSNLFHSFKDFNINQGESANFFGPDSIENIIGRVTGGDTSSINGSLNSWIPGANLFLINPAGIVFGPDAELNVQGSFHASTADYIRLGENGSFNATQPENSVLAVDPPSAFGFLSDNSAPISVQHSTLKSSQGETLSLVGGDIDIVDSEISSKDGAINIVTTSSPGEIITTENFQPSTTATDSFSKLGTIHIDESMLTTGGSMGGNINISGKDLCVESTVITNHRYIEESISNLKIPDKLTTTASEKAGDINIMAENIILDYCSITSSTYNDKNAGNINIKGTQATINNTSIFSNSLEGATGDGGNIQIDIDDLVIGKDTYITSVSDSPQGGNAGDIEITSNILELLPGANISTETSEQSTGEAGTIRIQTDSLLMKGGKDFDSCTRIASDTGNSKDAGNIEIVAQEKISLSGMAGIFSTTHSTGKGGNIEIQTNNMELKNGALISTSNVSTSSRGQGGNISVIANDLQILDGAQIQSGNFGQGDGGMITVSNSNDILVSGYGTDGHASGIRTDSQGAGQGGQVHVQSNNIRLENGGTISAKSSSTGQSGAISIQADDSIEIKDGSSITVQTKQADAGDIEVTAGNMIYLLNKGEISTSVAGGQGDGGNINLESTFVILNKESKIIANAREGNGGNINVQIQQDGAVLKSAESTISASSEFGVDGAVTINAPDTDITGAISTPPVEFFDASSILSDRCVTRGTSDLSSFNVVGRGGMAFSPDTHFPAFYSLIPAKKKKEKK